MKINFRILGILGIVFGFCVFFYYGWYIVETLSDLAFIMVGFLSCFFIMIGISLTGRSVHKSISKNKEKSGVA